MSEQSDNESSRRREKERLVQRLTEYHIMKREEYAAWVRNSHVVNSRLVGYFDGICELHAQFVRDIRKLLLNQP